MKLNKSGFDSFKSKKILKSNSKSSISPSKPPTLPHLDVNPWDSKTPEKPVNPFRRTRNRDAAMSLKEVREAAQKLWKSDPGPPTQTDSLLMSAKERIPLRPDSSPSKSKKFDSSYELPEKYEILDKFFRSFDFSIQLLLMRGSATTFAKLNTIIERLTDRRFTYSHLAQLKFILPEAIEVKKTMTKCMKPDLLLSINPDAIENNGKTKSESGNLQLRQVFRARLFDFFKAHPEGDEIPLEVLPEPFNQSNKWETKASGSSVVNQIPATAAAEMPPPIMGSVCFSPPAFRRHFLKQLSDHNRENTIEEEESTSGHAVPLPVQVACFAQQNSKGRSCVSASASPIKSSSKPVSGVECSSNKALLAKLPISPPPANPVKDVPTPLDCIPAKLMSATPPSLRETKRCYMSPDGDDSIQSPNKLVRRASRSRSLKFDTPKKGANIQDDVQECEYSSVHNDTLDILPETQTQSIMEKERVTLLEKDLAISQEKWRKKMIEGLPKLVDTIYFLLESIWRSFMTKGEFIYLIIAKDLDVVDIREVEEGVTLLQELVPEWICEKMEYGYPFIYVKTIAPREMIHELIRTRLAEAE